jgi:hypothetical protein
MILWVSQRRGWEQTIRRQQKIWNIVTAYILDSFASAVVWVCERSNEPLSFTEARKGTDHPKRNIDLEPSVSL